VEQPRRRERTYRSVRSIFAVYAVVSLVPVVLLGAVLLTLQDRQGDQHGLSEGRAKADLLARTTIAPLLAGHDLRSGLTPTERTALQRSVTLAVKDRQVLRLRLRDLDGRVVFTDDGSSSPADDEALDAAEGQTVAHVSRLDADAGSAPSEGPRVVEVYEPLGSSQSGRAVGVLEVYLPYAPIAKDIAQGQRAEALAILGGLLLVWVCLLAVSASVTRRLRRQSRTNAFLARHDTLTGMPNRSQFTQRAEAAIAVATAERPVAIALIDLDRFKEVNDTLGHENGDQLLMLLAERLKLYIREDDTIARLGGDEFGVVLTGVHGAGEAAEVLGRLRAAVNQPVEINGLPLAMEASAGFALAPEDGTDIGTLQQRADVAMYVAKRGHSGIARYRVEQDQYDAAKLSLIGELGAAIAEDQLLLHYQPKGDVHGATVIAVEALVRWQHPTRGLLYPDAFLPAAEQTELIEDLTRWVLRRASLDLPQLDPTGQLAVAVNVSARSLGRAEFAADVLAALAEAGTDPARVILEITETALMADPARASRTLVELARAGLRISIDDFGAGHTSLGYLATLPITELKIDKGFVLSMLTDDRNTAIVRSVIELGHGLGFTVTAEGVETIEMLQQLTALRCDTVQGYLLARPGTSSELSARMAEARVVLTTNQAPVTAAPG
jgi:diguanylate cyclase (GGDEF)-like protein